MDIIPIQEANIPKQYLADARRSGLIFCRNTCLYGLYLDGDMAGFGGVIFHKNKAVFKNQYIVQQFRRQGFFKALLNSVIEQCLEKGISKGEATCTDMSLPEYIKRGFVVVKKYKKYTKVRCENLSQAKRY